MIDKIRGGSIAVLIPCMNEEVTVGNVIQEVKSVLPASADIYVYDNNSTDSTFDAALKSGAIVRSEPKQGKGNVIRRMFSDVDADVYVLVDGDMTYDVSNLANAISLLCDNNLDMVTGVRHSEAKIGYRFGHRLGNYVLTKVAKLFFGHGVTDMLSGYRVLSKRLVKTFPADSKGFEVETELSIYSLSMRLPIDEIYVAYKDRPQNSASKLKTYRDGFRVLSTILNLVRRERPLFFFGFMSMLSFALGLGLFYPVFEDFLVTNKVDRLPTAILSMGLVLISIISLVAGLLLDSVANARNELRRLQYLKLSC